MLVRNVYHLYMTFGQKCVMPVKSITWLNCYCLQQQAWQQCVGCSALSNLLHPLNAQAGNKGITSKCRVQNMSPRVHDLEQPLPMTMSF